MTIAALADHCDTRLACDTLDTLTGPSGKVTRISSPALKPYMLISASQPVPQLLSIVNSTSSHLMNGLETGEVATADEASQADLRFSLKCSCERASNLSRSTKALAESEAQRATNQGQRRGSAFGSGAFALTLFDTPAVLDSNDVWAHLDLDSGALHMRGDCKLQLEATFPLGEVRRHLRITLI